MDFPELGQPEIPRKRMDGARVEEAREARGETGLSKVDVDDIDGGSYI